MLIYDNRRIRILGGAPGLELLDLWLAKHCTPIRRIGLDPVVSDVTLSKAQSLQTRGVERRQSRDILTQRLWKQPARRKSLRPVTSGHSPFVRAASSSFLALLSFPFFCSLLPRPPTSLPVFILSSHLPPCFAFLLHLFPFKDVLHSCTVIFRPCFSIPSTYPSIPSFMH